jgi:uncharacterized protein (TIGR02996 family)
MSSNPAVEAAFLEEIRQHPTEDTARLVFADWLEEQGDARAPFFRPLTNSLGMKFVRIPAGRFLMGSPKSEEAACRAARGWRYDDEGPQHEVLITRPFYLGIYAVTQEEYQAVTGQNPSDNGPTTDVPDTHRFPVENVTWYEAVEFCRLLSSLPAEAREGRRYRLPTEAEWEYAARAGSQTPFSCGDSLDYRQANFWTDYPFGGGKARPALQGPTPVGSYPPNAFGLYDMHGNVREWCDDWYDEDYDKLSPREDPSGPRQGVKRTQRGGAFNGKATLCRSACRLGVEPETRSWCTGFRCAMDIVTVQDGSGEPSALGRLGESRHT